MELGRRRSSLATSHYPPATAHQPLLTPLGAQGRSEPPAPRGATRYPGAGSAAVAGWRSPEGGVAAGGSTNEPRARSRTSSLAVTALALTCLRLISSRHARISLRRPISRCSRRRLKSPQSVSINPPNAMSRTTPVPMVVPMMLQLSTLRGPLSDDGTGTDFNVPRAGELTGDPSPIRGESQPVPGEPRDWVVGHVDRTPTHEARHRLLPLPVVFSLSLWERVGVRGLPVPVHPRQSNCIGASRVGVRGLRLNPSPGGEGRVRGLRGPLLKFSHDRSLARARGAPKPCAVSPRTVREEPVEPPAPSAAIPPSTGSGRSLDSLRAKAGMRGAANVRR